MAKHGKHKELMPTIPPSIRIEKAENGYIVSKYWDKGMKQVVFKDVKEMMGGLHKMLNYKET